MLELSGNGHEVTVWGSLEDRGKVVVTVDGEQRTFTTSGANTVVEEPETTYIETADGVQIDEGPSIQKIAYPDGTYVRRGAVSARATFPDGTYLQTESDDLSFVQITVEDERTDPAEDREPERDRIARTYQLVRDFSFLLLFAGLIVWYYVRFDVLLVIFGAAAVFFSLRVAMLYREYTATVDPESDDNRGETDELALGDAEDEIERLQMAYSTGEIDDIGEYEERLDRLLTAYAKTGATIEIEREY